MLLPDNDPVGREHVTAIAESLASAPGGYASSNYLTCRRRATSSTGTRRAAAAEEFARLVAAAPDYVPDEAAGPQPLMRPLPPPEPFPLEALGPDLASAAQAICDVVQSPIEMCAGAVLASTSFAVSAHVSIKLPTGQTRPTSCWFWCVAELGRA